MKENVKKEIVYNDEFMNTTSEKREKDIKEELQKVFGKKRQIIIMYGSDYDPEELSMYDQETALSKINASCLFKNITPMELNSVIEIVVKQAFDGAKKMK